MIMSLIQDPNGNEIQDTLINLDTTIICSLRIESFILCDNQMYINIDTERTS